MSLTGLLRESNNDLKNQLHHERTEERRKLVKGNKDDASRNVHEKWRKILGSAMSQNQAEKEDQSMFSIQFKNLPDFLNLYFQGFKQKSCRKMLRLQKMKPSMKEL